MAGTPERQRPNVALKLCRNKKNMRLSSNVSPDRTGKWCLAGERLSRRVTPDVGLAVGLSRSSWRLGVQTSLALSRVLDVCLGELATVVRSLHQGPRLRG